MKNCARKLIEGGLKVNPKKGGVCRREQVIDIIDYAVDDEKDAEGLRGLMDKKSKERFPKEHQRKI